MYITLRYDNHIYRYYNKIYIDNNGDLTSIFIESWSRYTFTEGYVSMAVAKLFTLWDHILVEIKHVFFINPSLSTNTYSIMLISGDIYLFNR